MASRRKPSTPVSSQRFITCTNALTTRGLSKLRSGWCEKKRCQENWPASGSQVQFDFSVSVKMIRVPWYFWAVSLQTYQLRAPDFGSERRARLNQSGWAGGGVMKRPVVNPRAGLFGSWGEGRESLIVP